MRVACFSSPTQCRYLLVFESALNRIVMKIRAVVGLIPIRAVQSSAQLLGGRAFPLIGALLAGILVARTEGPSSFGLYTASFALCSLTVGGATSGLPILLLRRSAEGNIDSSTLKRAVLYQLGASCVAIPASAILGSVIFDGSRGFYATLFAATYFAVTNLATMGQNVHGGRRHFWRVAGADMVAGALYPALTALALALGYGVPGALLALAVAAAVSCLVAWTALPTFPMAGRASSLKVLDGMTFTAFGLAKAGYGRLDAVILSIVAGPAVVGYYSAAYRLLGPFVLGGAAFATVYFTHLSHAVSDPERWMRVRRHGALLLFMAAFIGMVSVSLVVPKVVDVLYGEGFSPAIAPARILMLSIIPWALYWPRLLELASVHQETRATVSLTIRMVVDVVLVVSIGARFGAVAAAWAWVASEFATLLTLSLLSRGIDERLSAQHARPASPAQSEPTC
jgi:O-antigen/teichoic acid export membrane protein